MVSATEWVPIKPTWVKEGIAGVLTQFPLSLLWWTDPQVTPDDSLPTGVHASVWSLPLSEGRTCDLASNQRNMGKVIECHSLTQWSYIAKEVGCPSHDCFILYGKSDGLSLLWFHSAILDAVFSGPLAGVKKKACWGGPHDKEVWEASRTWGQPLANGQQKAWTHSYSYKEVHSVNNLKDLGNDSSPIRPLDENEV